MNIATTVSARTGTRDHPCLFTLEPQNSRPESLLLTRYACTGAQETWCRVPIATLFYGGNLGLITRRVNTIEIAGKTKTGYLTKDDIGRLLV